MARNHVALAGARIIVALGCCLVLSACGEKHARVVEFTDKNNGETIKFKADSESPARSKITREQVARLQPGLSPREVTDILGPAFFEAGAGNTSTMQWTDMDRKTTIHVIFDHGKAAQMSAAGLEQEKDRITRANLSLVKTGMEEAEVSSLLGPCESVTIAGNNKTLIWQANGMHVVVQVVDGRVTNKIFDAQ